MGLAEDKQREQAVAALQQANILPAMWVYTLPSCGARGVELRAYLQSSKFAEDRHEGIGYCFSGHATRRIDLFHTFVKEMALSLDNVYLITLRKLVSALTYNDGDFLYRLDRIGALAISYFYDSSIPECPYSYQERSKVEDYLREKLQANQRVYISASDPIRAMLWWSSDFRSELSKKCMELKLGKDNRG